MRHPQGLVAGMMWFDPDRPDALSNIRHLAQERDGTILSSARPLQMHIIIRFGSSSHLDHDKVIPFRRCAGRAYEEGDSHDTSTKHVQGSRSMGGRRMMGSSMVARSSSMEEHISQPPSRSASVRCCSAHA